MFTKFKSFVHQQKKTQIKFIDIFEIFISLFY